MQKESLIAQLRKLRYEDQTLGNLMPTAEKPESKDDSNPMPPTKPSEEKKSSQDPWTLFEAA